MSRDIAPFGVRMPASLKEQLQTMASDNKRSLNAEIVAAIELAWGMHQLKMDLESDALSKASRPAKLDKRYAISEDEIKGLVEEITDNVLRKLDK